MGTKVSETRKDGLIYFNPYWEVDMGTYVNAYPGCDAFFEYVGHDDLIRIYVCAGSVNANDTLVHVRCSDSRYNKYGFLNISSAYEMGDISSVFLISSLGNTLVPDLCV